MRFYKNRLQSSETRGTALLFAVLLATLIFCLSLLWRSLPAWGEELTSDAGFVVSTVTPANQRDEQAGYFDLLVQPGQKQELTVAIENPGEEEIEVQVEAVTACTNRNGIILYSGEGHSDETLPIDFAQVANPREKSLLIPPGATEYATVDLELPEMDFDGTLLGAIRVLRLPNTGTQLENGVVNQFSYVIGVRLSQEGQSEILPEFALGEAGLELVNYKAAIQLDVRNTRPLIVKGAQVAARIYQDGVDTPVIEKHQESVDMAPHSIFPMTLIDQEGYGFADGFYRAEVTVEYKEQQWEWIQEFEIAQEQALEINDQAVNQRQNRQENTRVSPWTTVFLALGGGVVLLAIILVRIKFAKSM